MTQDKLPEIILMMMMVVWMMMTMMEGPICENVSKLLDMTAPNLGSEGVQTSFCCRTQ